MVEKSARLITDSIIAEGLIAENLKDWYVYSFTRILEMAINVGTILLLSVVFHNTVPTILFLLFFNTLRQRTGGFHCNGFWQCYIVTNMLYVLISFSEKIIVMHGVILCIATAISAAVIFVVISSLILVSRCKGESYEKENKDHDRDRYGAVCPCGNGCTSNCICMQVHLVSAGRT